NALLPSRSSVSRPPRAWFPLHRHRDTLHPPLPPLGKRIASLAQTFLSTLREPCAVQQGRSWFARSSVEKPMAACASSLVPAFGVVGPVRFASGVNGMVLRRQS